MSGQVAHRVKRPSLLQVPADDSHILDNLVNDLAGNFR